MDIEFDFKGDPIGGVITNCKHLSLSIKYPVIKFPILEFSCNFKNNWGTWKKKETYDWFFVILLQIY